jgi:hypothetical protein
VAAIEGDVLIVRGHISPTVELHDVYRLPVALVPKADEIWADQVASRPLTPTYHVNLISGTVVLHSEPFASAASADQETHTSSFGLVIPWDPSTTRIDVTADGSTVVSVTISASPPTVTALFPNGSESFTDTIPVTWAASDSDGDELSYAVLYSADGGGSWRALATGVQTTTYAVDATLLPGSAGQSLIRVVASDGLNSASRQSAGGFTLTDRPPFPIIYFPDDGGEYTSGSTITARGAAYDSEDGYLPSNVISWTLSGRGIAGTGESLDLDELLDGRYTLTLTTSDSADQVRARSVSFTVGGPRFVYLPLALRS